MSITIIEGVDGVGKSTLAGRLAESQSATLLHKSAPVSTSWRAEYVAPLTSRLRHPAHQSRDLVLDRWHMGELVWPVIFGRPSLFSARDYAQCCAILADMGATLLLVVRDEDGIRRTLTERGEGDTIPGVLRAQELYHLVADLTPYIPVNVVDSDALHTGRSLWTSPA